MTTRGPDSEGDLPGPGRAFPAVLWPAGIIATPYAGQRDCPRVPWSQPGISRVTIADRYRASAEGLTPGTRVYLLWWAHQADRTLTRRRPAAGAPEQGVFCSRGPDRPNPIGLTLAVIVHVDLPDLFVRGADCIDQTTLLDIKPALVADNTLWQ